MKLVETRLSKNGNQDVRFHGTVKLKLERSLIGFFEAEAFTRALLGGFAGEESDVASLYEWWKDLWTTVPFERVRFERKSGTTFPSLLTQSLPPSDLLLMFMNIDTNGRYQNMCASWMVTHWVEQTSPSWSSLLATELYEIPVSVTDTNWKVKSQKLMRKLIQIGLPPHEDKRRNKAYLDQKI